MAERFPDRPRSDRWYYGRGQGRARRYHAKYVALVKSGGVLSSQKGCVGDPTLQAFQQQLQPVVELVRERVTAIAQQFGERAREVRIQLRRRRDLDGERLSRWGGLTLPRVPLTPPLVRDREGPRAIGIHCIRRLFQ